MGFYQCPLSPQVQRLFRPVPELLARPRIPLAERARLGREANSEPSSNELLKDDGFQTFPAKLQRATVSNFDQLFRDQRITFSGEKDPEEKPIITVEMFEQRERGASDHLAVLLRINPYLELMELSWIKSKNPGFGGRALLATYNMARELGLNKIYYIVNPINTNARRFYYHMDFGRPAMDRDITCEVEVR